MKTFWTIFITVIVVGVLAGGGTYYFARNQQDQNRTKMGNQISQLQDDIKELKLRVANAKKSDTAIDNTSTSTFVKNTEKGYYGTLTLTGYLVHSTKSADPFDETVTEKVDYVSFKYTKSDSNLIDGYVVENKGNSFVGENSIGLGCYDNAKIYSSNDSDMGEFKNAIVGSELETLLSSTSENQVKLQLTKPILTGGRGAPACYSHFRNFKIVN